MDHATHLVATSLPGARRHRDAGQAFVELVLVTPLLLVLLIVAVDVGQLFFVYNGVVNAAREGTLYASQHPAAAACPLSSTSPIYVRAVRELNPGYHGSAGVTVCVAGTAQTSGSQITVTVTVPFSLIPGENRIPGVGGSTFGPITLSSSSTAVIP